MLKLLFIPTDFSHYISDIEPDNVSCRGPGSGHLLHQAICAGQAGGLEGDQEQHHDPGDARV